jgi:uncharacterized protein YdaU (DUF1376 family)
MKEKKQTRKAPAFQLYTDDFLAGTLDMSQAEVGQLIRLLCHQWNRGSIPVETEKQQRLAGGCVSVEVLAKFEECEDGLLRNRRLESVRTEKGVFLQEQSRKGRLSAEKRRLAALAALANQPDTQPDTQPDRNQSSTGVQPDDQPNGKPTPQPDSNSPSPSPNNKEESLAPKAQRLRFSPPSVEEVEDECSQLGLPAIEAAKFVNYYESKGWVVGRSKMKSWKHSLANWRQNYMERQPSLPVQPSHKKEIDWRDSL